MILVIDNYDSFTYNLVQYLGEMRSDIMVKRNDEITLDEIEELNPERIVISPGPCTPREAGISVGVVKRFAGNIPILGVCLGHQAIGEAFGGEIVRAKKLMHGKISLIRHDGQGVLRGIPSPFEATRYHSLVINPDNLPDCLQVTAYSPEGEIMGVRHKQLAVEGVQFHPESVLTLHGKQILANFIGVEKAPEVSHIRPSILKASSGENLTEREAAAVMDEIMTGKATPAQIASLITALHMKGEIAEELVGFARVMRSRAVEIRPKVDGLMDTCGTGGDTFKTFNVSTAVAFVLAACGIPIAKHGNRAITSKSGSADVLEELGINLNIPPKAVERSIEEIGIGFLFAPALHPAMKHAGPARRDIGIKTLFNVLGPLTNPAGAKRQIIGVYDEKLVPLVGEVLKRLNCQAAAVVHGRDGLDEVSVCQSTAVAELVDGVVRQYELIPADFGLDACEPVSLLGGTVRDNAQIILTVFAGAKGPRHDIVCANAALALRLAGRAETLTEGFAMASEALSSGGAMRKLNALREFTQAAAASE